MSSKPKIAVAGSSGQIGKAVICGLQQNGYYEIIALVRDENCDAARMFKEKGITVRQIDYNNPQSIINTIKDCKTCFLTTKTVFSEPDFEQVEISQGLAVVDACNECDIYLIYNTQIQVEFSIGILARQHDAKGYIEQKLNEQHIASTKVMIPIPYDTLLDVHKLKYKDDDKSHLRLEIPIGELPFDGIGIQDAGIAIAEIARQREELIGKTIALSAAKMTVAEMASELSLQLRQEVRDGKIALRYFKQQQFPGAEDIANMYDFLTRMDIRYNPQLTRTLVPGILNFREWVKQHKEQIILSFS